MIPRLPAIRLTTAWPPEKMFPVIIPKDKISKNQIRAVKSTVSGRVPFLPNARFPSSFFRVTSCLIAWVKNGLYTGLIRILFSILLIITGSVEIKSQHTAVRETRKTIRWFDSCPLKIGIQSNSKSASKILRTIKEYKDATNGILKKKNRGRATKGS